MESVKVSVVEILYAGDPLARSFIDPKPPLEVHMFTKLHLTGGSPEGTSGRSFPQDVCLHSTSAGSSNFS